MNDENAQQVVLVAGGTGDLGTAVTLAYLAAGATVAITYQNLGEFERLRDLASGNTRLTGFPADVNDHWAVQELVAGLHLKFKRIDALVNAVGGYVGGANLWESDRQDLEHMLAINLSPAQVLARAVVPDMLRQKHGSIVNVGAKAGLEPMARGAAYAASKAAMMALMRGLASEVAGTGVRVNLVVPSIMDTARNRASMPNANFDRWPKVTEVARVILFLGSEEAKAIHGATVPVYGAS